MRNMASSASCRGIAAIVGVGPKLGRSIARKFAHEGYTVAILARDLGIFSLFLSVSVCVRVVPGKIKKNTTFLPRDPSIFLSFGSYSICFGIEILLISVVFITKGI